MKPEAFLRAQSKVKRTVAQIADLEASIKDFLDTEPYQLACEQDSDQTIETWRLVITDPLPIEIAVDVGQIVHNLRSALDNMISAVAEQQGLFPPKAAFPFGTSEKQFEEQLAQKAGKLTEEAKDMIRAERPYRGADNHLRTLNELSNADKHSYLLAPIITAIEAEILELGTTKGNILTLGPRNGCHLEADPSDRAVSDLHIAMALTLNGSYVSGDAANNLRQPTASQQPEYRFENGKHKLVVNCSDELVAGAELLTAKAGTKFEIEYIPNLIVTLGGAKRPNSQPIVEVLNEMRDTIQHILLKFELRYFSTFTHDNLNLRLDRSDPY